MEPSQHNTNNVYSIYLLTYLDILGWRSIIDEKNAHEILDILNSFRKCSQPNKFDLADIGIKYLNFSDLVVRARLLNSQDISMKEVYIVEELQDLNRIIIKLLRQYGLFIRGALTIGELFFENGLIFGPSLIQGYELESRQAIYPRIIIDDKLHRQYNNEDVPIQKYCNFDGVNYYLDYLKSSQEQFGSRLDYLKFLNSHKQFIQQNLKKYERNKEVEEVKKVLEKYNWLKQYHNSVISDINDKNFEHVTDNTFLKKDLYVS